MIELTKVFAGEALMELGQLWVRGRKGCVEIVEREQHASSRCVEHDGAAKRGMVGSRVHRDRVWQFDLQRTDLARADPAEKPDERHENELNSLARNRPIASREHEGHAASRLLCAH